jgi:hypothetical protein
MKRFATLKQGVPATRQRSDFRITINPHIKPNPSEYIMKRDIRHALLAMLVASASLGTMQQVSAAPGDPGEGIYGGGDKLLGAQDNDGDGYADPYGTEDAGAARGTGIRQNGQNNPAAPGQGAGTGAGNTKPVNANNAQGADADGQPAGAPALKRNVRARAVNPADPARQTPDGAAQSVYGMTAAKPAARKTTEIYRSPY